MEIDSTVSKQTTILIDLHPQHPPPFFKLMEGGGAPIPFLSGVSIDHPGCVSLRMCFPSLGDNGFLTTPVPGFNAA